MSVHIGKWQLRLHALAAVMATLLGCSDGSSVAADANDGGAIVADGSNPGRADAGDPSGPVRLAAGTAVNRLRIDNEYVYWCDRNGIHRVSKQGGNATTLHDGVGLQCRAMLVDDSHVYLGGSSGAKRIPKDGGEAETLFNHSVWRMTDDEQFVYWTGGTMGRIHRWAKASVESPAFIATDLGELRAIESDASYIYTIQEGDTPDAVANVLKVSKSGDSVENLGGWEGTSNSMAVSAADVYWTNKTVHAVLVVPKSGGEVLSAATNAMNPTSVAVDDDRVYFSIAADTLIVDDYDGWIFAVSHLGGQPTQLAGDQLQPGSIAVDDEYVYWHNTIFDGSIMRLAKE